MGLIVGIVLLTHINQEKIDKISTSAVINLDLNKIRSGRSVASLHRRFDLIIMRQSLSLVETVCGRSVKLASG